MNTLSSRRRAGLDGFAGLLSSLIVLGLVGCGGGSSGATSSSSSGSGGSGGSGGTSSNATYTLLYSLGSVANDGQQPNAGLIQGTDGNLYGTTYEGGTYHEGTVFRISPSSGAETVVYSFGSSSGDGEKPSASLIQGSNGDLYGTTNAGGAQGLGTVFEVSPSSGAETVLYSFLGSTELDGANPTAGLIQGSDGTLYGTTFGGGDNQEGTVFSISLSTGAETVLYAFAGTPDGEAPGAALIQGSDGNLYGTTTEGGTYNDGTIFQIAPGGGAATVIYSFGAGIDPGTDPDASALIQDSAGNFYGTTLEGGTYGTKAEGTGGTVFMFSASSGTETTLYSFGSFSGDGVEPEAGVTLGSDGNLYGTTFGGGAHGSGTVYEIAPSSGDESILYSFGSVSADGTDPLAALIQGSNGSFYGTTSAGGANSAGAVFEITPN